MAEHLADLICERRTVHQFTDEVITQEILFDILAKAGLAPFHAAKEPWHVHYLASEKAKRQAEKATLNSFKRNPHWQVADSEYHERMTKKAHKMFVENPVTLLIGRDTFDNEHEEMIALTSLGAFIQNIQLLAWELGIGVVWGSHTFIEDSNFLADLDLPEQEKIVAHVHMGYIDPKEHLMTKKRLPINEWLSVL